MISMEVLQFNATDDTPEVVLNKEKEVFSIVGNSFSEDPFTIYGRIFTWLKYYAEDPNEQTKFSFKLNYVNTASSKQIVEILGMLEAMKEKSNITIQWIYQDGDEDTLIEGKELEQMFNLEFDFIVD